MEYKIKADLLQGIINLLTARPYKEVYMVLDPLRKEVEEQTPPKEAASSELSES